MYIWPCLRLDERQLIRCKPHAVAVFLVYLSSSTRELTHREPVCVREYGSSSVPRAWVGAKRMKEQVVKSSCDTESERLCRSQQTHKLPCCCTICILPAEALSYRSQGKPPSWQSCSPRLCVRRFFVVENSLAKGFLHHCEETHIFAPLTADPFFARSKACGIVYYKDERNPRCC